jgi:phage-related protein
MLGNKGSVRKMPLAWIGSSRQELLALPMDIRQFFAHALDSARRGEPHDAARMMKGFDDGVWQVVRTERDITYRTVYAVQSDETILVLYCSRRKTRKTAP